MSRHRPSHFRTGDRDANEVEQYGMKERAVEVSFLHQVWWHNYRVITGRTYSMEDIHDEKIKGMIAAFVAEYQPQLRRLRMEKVKRKASTKK